MSGKFVAALCVTGVCAGLVGIALTKLLHLVQHTSFGYTENTFLYGVERAGDARRVLVLFLCGVVAGLGWWAIRARWKVRSVDAVLRGDGRLDLTPTVLDSLLQVVVVGLGASLGREGAPRQISASLASAVGTRLELDADDMRILLAAGAGAGLAAVYDVPVAGVVFTLEALLRTRAPRAVFAAVVTSVLATVVSWAALPDAAVYPERSLRAALSAWSVGSLVAYAVVVGVAAVGVGRCFDLVMARARRRAPNGSRVVVSAVIAMTALGFVAVRYPQVLGNGKGPTDIALNGSLAVSTAAVLFVLKPFATALCLRSGLAGGLLTPSLSTGALLGLLIGSGWQHIGGSHTPVGDFALVGAAAVLAVTQRAPLSAAVLALELTRCSILLALPVAVAVAAATLGRAGLTAFRQSVEASRTAKAARS